MKKGLLTTALAVLVYAIIIALFTIITAHAQNVPVSFVATANRPDCDSVARAERAYRQDIARKGFKLATNLKADIKTANHRIESLTEDLNTERRGSALLKSENRKLRRENHDLKQDQPKPPTRVGKALRKARDGLAVVGAAVIVTAVTLLTLR